MSFNIYMDALLLKGSRKQSYLILTYLYIVYGARIVSLPVTFKILKDN